QWIQRQPFYSHITITSTTSTSTNINDICISCTVHAITGADDLESKRFLHNKLTLLTSHTPAHVLDDAIRTKKRKNVQKLTHTHRQFVDHSTKHLRFHSLSLSLYSFISQ